MISNTIHALADNLRKYCCQVLIFAIIFLIPVSIISEEEKTDSKISGFRFYLTDDDGKQKGVVAGSKADFLNPEEIEITDANAEILDIKYPLLIQAPKCTFSKSKTQISSSLPVVLKTIGIEIYGTGMQWYFGEKKIIIEKDVVVTIERNVQEETANAKKKDKKKNVKKQKN